MGVKREKDIRNERRTHGAYGAKDMDHRRKRLYLRKELSEFQNFHMIRIMIPRNTQAREKRRERKGARAPQKALEAMAIATAPDP